MNARMRRLVSDYEQVKKDFAGHKNIIVTPVGEEPPEKYHVTYFVNGIYLLPDGRIETQARHEVDIILHSDYPRYKPLCQISTPIWHPNFRDGQICIGDIWGAGESLSDIIINIGDMIQYKSWNSSSPLSADAAKWAIENKHLFPVGNINLNITDYASQKDSVEIDLFGDEEESIEEKIAEEKSESVDEKPSVASELNNQPEQTAALNDGNDFDITAEELEGIEFVPTAKRMQTVSANGTLKGNKINFKTVLVKGLMWALIGAFVGFGISEICDGLIGNAAVASMMGYSHLSDYYEYDDLSKEYLEKAYDEFEVYCKNNGINDDIETFKKWYGEEASAEAKGYTDEFFKYSEMADDAFYDSYQYEFNSSEDKLEDGVKTVSRVHTGVWSAVIALFIGLFLGVGEGIFYGSKENAVKYAAIGAGVSIAIGFISGYLAQAMYSSLLDDNSSDFVSALVRGFGWAIMGIGIGIAVGLIKPEKKRILFCTIGGLAGAFIGGFLFNYVCDIIPDDVVARGVAIMIMGLLIGVGVGVLEQFAKQAWLKVIRGEFEGKEYLVFTGTTSIGNSGKNDIVLFKDKLVGPHHCDIVLEGSKYVLNDCGTPMGTVVNGMKVNKHILRQGDSISIGNSVLIFNTK